MSKSTHIRIDLDVKKKLEKEGESRYRYRSHSDTISALMDEVKRNDRYQAEREEQEKQRQQRRKNEDVTLKNGRKGDLNFLMDKLGLSDPGDVVDLLLYHFEHSQNFISADTLFYLADLKRR